MTGVAFLSQSYKLPSRVVSNAELEDHLSLGRGVIERLTGIRNRRYIADGESLQSLAVEACRTVLAGTGFEPADVDGLIYYTDSPPLMPEGDHYRKTYYDVSAHIQYLLRERGVPFACECIAIAGSCVSFLLSLQMAAGLIRSGMKKSILVVGAACNSLFLENTDKNVAITFGDAAAASLLADSQDDALVGIYCGTDGRGFAAGCYPDYGTLFIDRKRVAEFAPLAFRDAMAGLLTQTGLSLDDFDIIIPHQAGIKIIERGMELSGIPREKVYFCLQDVGNTGAPAVQLALAKAVEEGRVHDGNLVGLVAFGTGWHYGAAAIRFHDAFHKTVIRAPGPAAEEEKP
jgi:3-oxoacyl-[acyl-carrier-protein] synthase-3